LPSVANTLSDERWRRAAAGQRIEAFFELLL
jgi:hypothetical protein